VFFGNSGPRTGHRGSESGAVEILNPLAGYSEAEVVGISADGAFVAVNQRPPATFGRASRISADGTIDLVPRIPGEDDEVVTAISPDGGTLVGFGRHGNFLGERHQLPIPRSADRPWRL